MSDEHAKVDPLMPRIVLLSKLASIVVHADEMLSAEGHAYDRVALEIGIADPEVQTWLKQMGPYGEAVTEHAKVEERGVDHFPIATALCQCGWKANLLKGKQTWEQWREHIRDVAAQARREALEEVKSEYYRDTAHSAPFEDWLEHALATEAEKPKGDKNV